MNKGKKLVVLGFGGHARSVADVALACGYAELHFVDDNARNGESFLGYPVTVSVDACIGNNYEFFPAAGDNRKREAQFVQISKLGFPVATLISPNASIGIGSVILSGCFIGHHAHVGSMARIGRACIINTGAIVEHECQIGDFCHVSVNATMAGRSKLGDYSMLGAGATVIDQLQVCADVVVGAGAVVNKMICSPGVYVGVPAECVNKKN